jgi:glycerol-3-phosphate acyltransferase PlsX
MFKDILKEEISKSWLSKLGILLAMGAFRGMKRRLPIDKFSGAPLLGLNGLVVKAHGSSNAESYCSAIKQAISFAGCGYIDAVKENLEYMTVKKAEKTEE